MHFSWESNCFQRISDVQVLFFSLQSTRLYRTILTKDNFHFFLIDKSMNEPKSDFNSLSLFVDDRYAESVGARHFHTSAKLNKGIEELFLDLSKGIFGSFSNLMCFYQNILQ